MEKIKESEIRDESLQLVVETYRVSQLLPPAVEQKDKITFLNTSFKVSSHIADAYAAIQNDDAEASLTAALKSLKKLTNLQARLTKEDIMAKSALESLQRIIHLIQEDLEVFLASIQVTKLDQYSPKLEKTCI